MNDEGLADAAAASPFVYPDFTQEVACKRLRWWRAARKSPAPVPRFEVEVIDHDDVGTIDVGGPGRSETAHDFKFSVSNPNVAERVARTPRGEEASSCAAPF